MLSNREFALTATVCVYFLFDGPLLIYVGHTRNLARRIKQHRTENWKHFDGWGAFRTEARLGRRMERFYIDKHRPRYNDAEKLFRPRRYVGTFPPLPPIEVSC